MRSLFAKFLRSIGNLWLDTQGRYRRKEWLQVLVLSTLMIVPWKELEDTEKEKIYIME